MDATRGAPPSRRDVMRTGAGAGLLAVLSGGPALAAAATAASLQQKTDGIVTRPVPKTGEMVPAIGLGTYLTFDTIPGQKRDHLGEVMRTYWSGGAKVIDTSPLYGTGELTVGDYATALGITDKAFFANKIWSTGDFLADDSHAQRSLTQSVERLWREQIDLMQCHSLVNVDVVVPIMKAWKKEGRIRYVGVTHHQAPYFDILASWIDKGDLDFVQVSYSIFNRKAEQKVLPAAAAKGTAVLVNMPLDKARLFKAVEGQPLPDFAKEIGAKTWAAFFLKWVISHPAVTCAIPATANPAHAAENIAALQGPLPDQAMRDRMVQHMESLPGFAKIAELPYYPDKTYPGIIRRAQSELKARG